MLNEFAKQGHCFAEQYDLIVQGSKLLGIDETRLVMTLGDMWHTGDVIAENNHSIIYLPFLFHSKSGVSKLIKEIQSTLREKQIKIFTPPSLIGFVYAYSMTSAKWFCCSPKGRPNFYNLFIDIPSF